MVGRESSSLSSELETTRLLGGILSNPVQDHIYHDKNVSSLGDTFHRSEMNYKLGYGNAMKDHKTVPFMETNLIDLDDPIDSEATSTNPKEVCLEMEVLKKRRPNVFVWKRKERKLPSMLLLKEIILLGQ